MCVCVCVCVCVCGREVGHIHHSFTTHRILFRFSAAEQKSPPNCSRSNHKRPAGSPGSAIVGHIKGTAGQGPTVKPSRPIRHVRPTMGARDLLRAQTVQTAGGGSRVDPGCDSGKLFFLSSAFHTLHFSALQKMQRNAEHHSKTQNSAFSVDKRIRPGGGKTG